MIRPHGNAGPEGSNYIKINQLHCHAPEEEFLVVKCQAAAVQY